MTNAPNKWIAQAWRELKRTFKPICRCKMCRNFPRSKMEFSHEIATKLSHGNPRGRKEKYYDIMNHPKHYKLRSPRCHRIRKASQHRRFRREAKQ